jgi:hypothetical protein
MTVTITKPSFNLRDALVSLKRKIGIKGAELMAAETVSDVYSVIGTNRNKIINGDMRIDQRNAGATIANNTAGTQFSVDRWNIFGQQASKFNAQQSSTAPAGFTSSLLITSASAYTPLTGDRFIFRHKVEGNNISDLAWGTSSAKYTILSFWVRSSITGTYGGVIHNDSQTRSFPYTYIISQANTWEYKTVAISGCTDGTWETGTATGIQIWFSLGAGATYQSSTSGAWVSSGNPTTPIGCVDLVATNGATFYITGVQLEKGTVATPFEHRLYGTELALCQRYCYVVGGSTGGARIGSGFVFSTTGAIGTITFPTIMRGSPSFSGNTSVTINDSISGYTVSNITLNDSNVQFAAFNLTSTGLTAGRGMQWYFTSSGTNYLILSSEL